jgi:1-acyl-sn-glycerol-3-phosphate acyltransferase
MRRFLKILASGAGFSALGVGGLLFSLVGLPLLRLLPGGRERLQRRTRWVIHCFFRTIVRFLEASGIFRVRAEGIPPREALSGHLLLATHPGYLDVVILLSIIDQLTCVVKAGVWNNPFFGRVVRAAGYIPALDSMSLLEEGALALARGEALLLFPEGTRTSPGLQHAFQRGAAHLALRSGAQIIPIIITCNPPLLTKGHRWFEMPKDPCDYGFRAAPPLELPRPEFEGLPAPRAARLLTRWLEGRFNQEALHAGHLPH